jgi:hypothetical protein
LIHDQLFGLSRSDAERYIQSDRPLAWALAALMRPPVLDAESFDDLGLD